MKKFICIIGLIFQGFSNIQAQENVLISPALSNLSGDYQTFFYKNNKASRLVFKGTDLLVEQLDNEKFRPTKDKRMIACYKTPKDGGSVSITKDFYCQGNFNFNNKTYVHYQNGNLNQRTDLHLLSLTNEGFKDEAMSKIEFTKNATSSTDRKFSESDYSASQGQSVFKGYEFKTSANDKYLAAFSHSRIFTKVTSDVKYYDVEPYDVCVYDKDFKIIASNTFQFKYEIKMANVVLGNDGQNVYLLKSTKRDNKDADYDILFFKLPMVSQNEDIKPIAIDFEDKTIITCQINTAPDGTILLTGSYTNKLKSMDLKNIPDGTFTMAYNATNNTFSAPQFFTFEGEFKKYITNKVTKNTYSFYTLHKIVQAADGNTYVIASIGVVKDYNSHTKSMIVTCLDRNMQHNWSTPVVHEMSDLGGLEIQKDIAVRFNDNELECFMNDNKQNYDSKSGQCLANFNDNEQLKSTNCVASIKFDKSNGMPKRRMIIDAEKIYYRLSTAIWNEEHTSLACEGNVGYTVSICKLSISK